MAHKCVYCVANSEVQAAEMVNQLKADGFSNNDISALLPDKTGTMDFAHEQHTKAPEASVAGVGLGSVVGGAVGWLAGIGVIAIPGFGPFIAAGPIMSVLSGIAVGGAMGGIAGALIGLGMPEFEAKRYEGKIKEGNILISVHTENNRLADRAKEIIERCGAQNIVSSSESRVSDASKS
jgi:hypothetical protein